MSRVQSNNSTSLCRMLISSLFAIVMFSLPVLAAAKTATIKTPLGDIEIELLEDDAPKTVANFLRYIENNRYENAFMHRSVSGFIIQGGGYNFNSGTVAGVESFEPVENEFKVSNTRGTVAMAKLGDQPDSATSQWFINLDDNSGNLDGQNGGFTVFGRVTGNGMAVADAIAALDTINAQGAFTDLPVINYSSGPILEENLVMTNISSPDAVPVVQPFAMNAGLNDAWYNPVTDGQGFFITVFPDLGLVNLAWFTYDTELPADDAPANLGSAGHRWLTAIGTYEGDSAVLNINIASGGMFDTATEIQNTTPAGADGTITLTFSDCHSGLVEYDIKSIDKQGSVPIQRIADDNAVLCEALLEE